MDLGAPVHVVLAGPRRTWIRRRLQALRVPYTFVGTTTANDREDLAANTLPREVLNELYNIVDLCLIASRSERSEEHTSELQSLMRISYAVFCLKKKKHKQ